jgi:hypothetical protein
MRLVLAAVTRSMRMFDAVSSLTPNRVGWS